jgi:hypothetical protein
VPARFPAPDWLAEAAEAKQRELEAAGRVVPVRGPDPPSPLPRHARVIVFDVGQDDDPSQHDT